MKLLKNTKKRKNYTNDEIEQRLYNLLCDLLESRNQESALINVEYDKEKNVCTAKLEVTIFENDDYND